MNNSLPELTPEQLRQLNAISGLQKTRRRGADASVPSALTAESESGEAPDISASYALPKPAPNMSEEDYERQIKEGLTEHIEAIYDRARQRADARRQETLARMDKGTDNASLWQQAWASYAKSQMLRSPSALGGEDTQLMQAAERALKILNQKTEKDKQAGDGTSGLTREIFDWQTLADFASLGTRELAENIVTTRALKKAARSERLTPTEKDIVELFRTSGLINEYIARRGGPTTGAKVGSGVAASLPYMAGFATTSGLGSGAAKTVGRALIKKEAKNLVGRGLRKLGEYTVSAAAMTPLQAGTYTNYHQRAQQQYTVAENGTVTEHPVPKYELMYKAAADSFTDVFTEHIGGELGKGVQKVLKWPVEQLGRRMGVKLSFDKLLPGYSRSRYLTDFRNRTLWNGPVDEWLEEVAGGILSPLLTGEHEQWRENLSGENLWTTFLTTSLMGAGFSALELPNVAAYVHKTHVLQTEEKKALAKIENEELRKQVFEAMHKPTMSQQAQAMAAIDWQAANIGKMDAAHAADYARFRLQRQILDGMETGDAEGEALHTAVQTAERWAYKGLDGKTATEEIITARRADGKTYVVLSGDTDEAATDGTLFVLDPETGQPGQIDRTELEHIERTPLAEFSARQAQIIEQQAEAENRAKQEQYDMETGTEAGIAPEEVARIVTPEAVQYANGDEVITADGVQGRITGKQGGSYVVQLDTGQFVLTPAHALTPKSEAPPPTETTTAIAPAQHNEATDTDTTNNEPIARQLAEAIRAAAGEQDAQRIIQRMLDGAADAGQRQMYSDALQFLQQHATATVPVEEHPTPVPAVPPPAAPARAEKPPIRKERPPPNTPSAGAFGAFVSLEGVRLGDIASGLRFAWKDSGNRRGLARELGFTGNENERRSRFSILSSDGITPEQYAERLYFQYGGGNTEQAHWDMDDKTIKDAVLEVLSRIHSPRQAYNAAVRLHNDTPNPYDDMDEEDYARMQEYEAEQERVRTELLYDDAFAQWAGQTSQDQWAEIDNLFIEDASESSKNTNFEATETAPPNPANYDDETENGNGIDTSAFGATGNDRSETVDGEQRNAPAGDDAYLGQQGGGSAAVRHGGGLDAISGPLTDDERRIAAETAAEIEARLDQYRAELHTLRTRYAAEKRNIGTAYEEDNQTTLFGPSHEPSDGDLFDVPRDFSDRNLNDILAPLQAEIGRLQERIARTEASKSKVIAEAVEAYHAQGTLPLREERQKEIPQNSTSAEDTFPPAITQEYDRYLHHAVASFPDKVFSVLNNDLIKAGFIRDVRRLAKKDVRAAIKLVAEANAAAQKYAGKPILTPRHSIHAELATLAESQHRTKTATSDTSAETGLFSPTEQTRHSKTGATLYSVKLAERIERNAFQSLKKRAKEHDGYYSSFTRSFLFDTPEDAEAFRGTAPTSDATRPTSEEQPAIQHPLFDKAALVPVDSYSPKAYNMYRFYSARAREGLGYKKQSIVQNDEARERFIDHIRKLAEQSADAAIRLVVEINKAAEQEEGKPVFPLQHSIYAELEEVHARQTAEKQQSETADDSASSAGTAPEYGAQNKLVTTEQYEELKRRMREKLGQLNAGFDPEILSIGAQMAAYHVEAGARRFADFSRRMIADLGDVIRPYLKPIYTAARQMPGMEEYAAQMDSYEQVEAFDMADLDKAEKTSQPTGTGAQYRLAGIYDMTGAVEKDTNETGNLRPEKNFRKDLERFSRAFADELGWEHETDRKGKTIYAQTNIAPAGGDGSFTLWAPETDLGIYVSVPVAPQSYDNRYGYSNNLKIKDIMGFGEPILWRLRNKEQTFLPNGHNRYAPADITVGELAELAKKELNAYLDNITAAKTLDHILQENQNTRNDERRENSSEKDYPAYGDGSRKDGALGTGILSAEKPVATVSGESGGIARFDRPDRNTGDAVAAGSTRTGRRSGSSGRVLLSTPPTVLLSGGAGTNTHQRKNDAGDHRHVEKGGESEVAKNTSYKNHVIERGHDLAPRGEVGKIKANLAAIRLIKEIEAEGREATPEEKAVLEQFSGWGGIPAIFKIAHPYHNELRELLTADEYEAARASTTTAFYTPPEVISSIWDMVERLGFDGGRILEPSAGIGHFFGLMPLSIRSKSDLTGIELDDLSGHILRALYPEAHIHIEGFEQQRIPNNSYSLVISNVPFGTFKVHDTFDRDLSSRFEIHDYFIAKSIRKLKPGGLGVFITSTATLDRSANLRNWVVNDGNADFIGAVRLNTGTFKNTAGTETSADIIIVRKRDEAGPAPYAVNMQSTITEREAPYERIIKLSNGKVKTEAATAHMNYNKYFHDNPQFMAGQMRFGFESGVEIRPTEQRCVPTSDIDQSRTLDSFISALPENIYTSAPAPATERIPQAVEAPNSTKEGGLTIIDGKPYIVRFGQAVPADWNSLKIRNRSKVEALGDYLRLKSAITELLDAERNDLPNIEQLRAELNDAYATFTRRYGTLSRNTRISFLRDDVDFPSIAAIENDKEIVTPDGKKRHDIQRSDIFFRRMLEPTRELKADTPKDAIAVSLYRYGRLDMPYIAELLHIPQEDTEKELLAQELIYVNPVTGLYEERNEYLSGNVREKLEQAEQANENGQFDANIRALVKIIPMDIPLPLIKVSLGSTWIPIALYEQFFKETFNVTAHIAKTSANKYIAKISNEGNTVDTNMGIPQAPGSKLALDRMNKTQTYISRSEYDPLAQKEKRVKDPEAMTQAAMKQTELEERFEQWIKGQDKTTTDKLVEIYNRTFNSTVERQIDVSSFDYFPNATHTKKPREHQKIGVMRGLQGATLLAHEVGTGKTLTLITTAMEMRRLGIAQKPCIVVQRSTFNQFASEIKSLYPAARVLVPSEKDLTASQRQELFAKIAYNDWDIVVLYHSYLDAIPDAPERVNEYIDTLIAEKMQQLEEIEANSPDNAKRQAYAIKKQIEGLENKKITDKTVKEEEKLKAQARTRALRLLDRRTDETMTFEQLGIDALLVDEAHAYKKLGFTTNLQNIKGIDPAASQRAQSMRLKTSYILANKQNKNVVFATGTPISNTMAEMWTFLRYLLPKHELEQYEIADFDSFANNFGNIEESAEFATNGKFRVVERFASYSNVPELLAIWKKVAHTVLTEDVPDLREGVGTPRIEGGKPKDILLDQTPALRAIMRSIREILTQYDAMSGKEKRRNSHIPLVMFGLAKRAAIDVRLVNPALPDDPNSKVNHAVREVVEDLKATADYNGTVAVFCDAYQSRDHSFNLFVDMKRKFIDAGIPAQQVAIIHDYITDAKREALYKQINNGEVRIVLGTTEKLGIGVNMQERLHMLVNLDVPIRPMDYLQRIGRIVRQGNLHLQMDKPVRILRLGVKQTLDVTGYQRLKIKESFIKQAMKGEVTERSLEEPETDSSDSTNFGQMMASLSGSAAALALSLEQNKLRKLRNARDYYNQHQIYVAHELKRLQNVLQTTPQIIAQIRKKKDFLRSLFPDDKVVSVEVGKLKASEPEKIEDLFVPLSKRIEAEADALRQSPDRTQSDMTLRIGINGKEFDIIIVLRRNYLSNEKERINRTIYYQCNEWRDLQGEAGAKMINVISQVEKVLSGEEYDAEIQKRQLGMETAQQAIEYLQTQVGNGFPKQAELEAAEERIAELEEQMKVELAAIEAQEETDKSGTATIDIDPDELIDDNAGNGLRFRDGGNPFGSDAPASDAELARRVRRIARTLNTPVEIIDDLDAITDSDPLVQRRKRHSKGFYDPQTGQTFIVLPNITTLADAEATVLHEIVGHMGLRSLMGDRFGDFLDKVYNGLDTEGRSRVADIAREQEHQSSGAKHRQANTRRLATEEYLAHLAEGDITPSRFARIIGRIRSLLRDILRLPLRIGDRDIAYLLWLSKHRLQKTRTAAEAVAATATERRIRKQLFGRSENVRYRAIFDDATPENIERYSIERYIREHHITGVLLGEHNADDFAMRVYGLLDDMGRAIIDRMGNDRLKAMRKYLALFDLQKLTDQESYRSIIDELVKTLPQETKEQIVRSMRKHLDFVLSDNYRTPLRRRTMKSERPLPENFKYASEYVEELLKKKRAQPEMAPPAGIEPTVIYDKRNWKSRQQLRFIDSTLPVERLQEEVVRRGGSIDDLTDIHKHLNHLTSIAKVAIDKYTKEYLDPILDQIAAIARETGMTETHIIDYITAESSLERQATGIAALSLDPRDAWNETLARSIVADFRRRAGEIPTQRLWQRINAANDRVLEILVEDGMLAPEHRKLIKGHGWDYYVPLRDYDYNYRDQKGEPVAFDAADVYDFIDDSAGPRPLRKVLHEAEGRIAKPRNPIAQMVNIGIGAIIAAKTNRARQSALRLVQNNSRNSEDLFRVDKVWLAKGIGNRWVTTTIDPAVEDIELSKAARKEIARLKKEMNAALQAHDDELADYLYNRIEETERFNIVREAESGSRFEHEGHLGHSYERQRNVECYVNGIRYVITFADPAVANAINQYNRLAIPKWLDDTVGNATRWLARAFTSRNPAFVAANFLRDVQHAALVHAIDKGGNLEGFVRNIPASMAAITRELRGKAEPLTIAETGTLDVLDTADRQELIRQFGRERVMDTLYDYFRENGGETGFVHSKDIAEAEKEIKRYVAFRTGRIGELLKATQRSERAGVWLSYAARKSGMQAIGVALENASRIAENTSRLATFTTSLEQGKSLLTAIDDAKNVTVNFNRRGTATRPLGMFYVFFNASVQGAAQVARIAMRNRKRFAQAVATLTAAGFLDSLLLDFFLAGSGGDGRDLAVTEYERHNHLIIPGMGKRGYLKIPLPQGFRAFFGIGTALHDLYRGKLGSEDAARMMLTMLYEDFSPVASPSSKGDATRVLIPTALTPWYDIWYAGEDAFGYPVGRRSYSTTANYPLSEMGLRNVNKAIYYLCRGINRLGGGDENTPAGLRKNGEIDPLLRGIFEYNPSHVEHVLTYYGGGMGKFIKDMVHTSQALFTGEEISSRDLPVINRFYGTARPENPAERYYTLRDRLTNIEAKYKRMGPALDRTDPAVQRNLQRIAIFKAHQTAVNKLRAILADTRPNTAAYDRLQEELNETMMNALNEDDHVTEY